MIPWLDPLLPGDIEGNPLRKYLEMRACWEYGNAVLESSLRHAARTSQEDIKQ